MGYSPSLKGAKAGIEAEEEHAYWLVPRFTPSYQFSKAYTIGVVPPTVDWDLLHPLTVTKMTSPPFSQASMAVESPQLKSPRARHA